MKGAAVTALESTLTLRRDRRGHRTAACAARRPAAARRRRLHRLAHARAGRALRGHEGPALRRARLPGRRRERGAAAAMVHRDVAAPPGLPLVRVADTTRALADLGRHVRRRRRVPVVAVTGSAGKTTTKEMTAALLGTQGPGAQDGGQPQQPVRPAPHAAAPRSRAPLRRARARHVRRGRAARALGDRAARRGHHHDGGARAPRVLRLRGRDRGRQGRDPRRASAPTAWPCSTATTRACAASASSARDARSGSAATARYDVSAENWRGTVHGMRFDLRVDGQSHDVALPLPGPHFLLNFLAAAAAAHHLGVARGRHRGGGHAPEGGQEPRPGAPPGRGRHAPRRLLQLEPGGGGGGGDRARHGRAGPPRGVPRRHARAGPDGAGAAPRDGRASWPAAPTSWSAWAPLGREFAEGARRAGLAAAALRDFADSRGGRARSGRASCSRATPCS